MNISSHTLIVQNLTPKHKIKFQNPFWYSFFELFFPNTLHLHKIKAYNSNLICIIQTIHYNKIYLFIFRNMFCKSYMFACTKAMEHVKNANIHLKYYSRNKLLIIIVTPMYTQPTSYYYYHYFQFCEVVTLAIIHKEKSIKIFFCCSDLLENV